MSRSNILDIGGGRIDIGRKSSGSRIGLSILGIGVICASFQILGNVDFTIHALMMLLSGLEIYSATGLMNLTGIESDSVEVSTRKVFISRRTSS